MSLSWAFDRKSFALGLAVSGYGVVLMLGPFSVYLRWRP